MELSEESSVTPRECAAPVPVLPFVRLSVSGPGPSERYGHTSVVVARQMWVFGGCDVAGRFFNDLHVLDLDTMKWESIVPSEQEWPVARHFHGAAAVGSKEFYIFFGKSNGYMNDVHAFDTSTRKWRKIEPENATPENTPSRRYGHSVVELNGDVLVFGGFDDFGLRCNDLWRFCVSKSEWSPMLHLQSEAPDALHHAAALCNGSMLVWGGLDATADVLEYRLGSRSWSPVKIRAASAPMPRPKWGHRMVSSGNELFVVGGTDGVIGHSSVWSFDLQQCQWTLQGEAEALAGRFFFSLVVHGSQMILFGGKNAHNYAFDDVLVWTFRASQENSVSTYREDFARLLNDAGPVSGCIKIESTVQGVEPVYGHAFILYARLPSLRDEQHRKLNVDGETLRLLLLLTYTGSLMSSPPVDLCMRLVVILHQLQAPKWMKDCVEGELVRLAPEGVVAMFKWVVANKQLKLGRLASVCIKVLVGSFEALRKSLRDQLPDEYYSAIKEAARKK